MSKLVMTLAAAATACGAGAEASNHNLGEPAQTVEPAPRSKAAFEAALARFGAGQATAEEVDRLAAQRYATVSRLYWHTDLEQAKAEAQARGLPILSLRLLGRLDEDYSCANSRFFRVALYANAEVSKLMREGFVLHWSSERAAPKITIDYGDGRVMRRTIAGNSAHYVLDSRGRPIDVMPGLYGPQAFLAALRQARALDDRLAHLDGEPRRVALMLHHDQRQRQTARAATQLASSIPGATIAAAESFAIGKSAVETPLIRSMEIDPTAIAGAMPQLRQNAAALAVKATLDRQSRALIGRLEPFDWSKGGDRDERIGGVIAGFEQLMGVDTAVNEMVLRPLISKRFVDSKGDVSFDVLNGWIYATLFRTPASDPWLGMSADGTFTGLPGDGVSLAKKP